jgi:hypothetical protein
MSYKEKTVPKSYETQRVPGRDTHSSSEKAVKHVPSGTQSHSGGKKKESK